MLLLFSPVTHPVGSTMYSNNLMWFSPHLASVVNPVVGKPFPVSSLATEIYFLSHSKYYMINRLNILWFPYKRFKFCKCFPFFFIQVIVLE